MDPEIEITFLAKRREQQGLAGMEEMAERVAGNMANDRQQVNINNPLPQLVLVDDRDKAIREYAVPILHGLNPGIVRPEIQAP